jgi:hypothetical protein
MVATQDMIDAYMSRLRDLAGDCNYIQRFYLFLTDEQLYDLEYELSNSDQADTFYDRLLEQYRAWRYEMGSERWAEVEAHNDALDGANRNWALDHIED